MKIAFLKSAAVILTTLASVVLAGTANAEIVDQSALTQGQSVQNLGTFTATASTDGFFDRKTVGPTTGVGISGGNSVVSGEIDNSESLTFTAATSQLLSSFTISFLYIAGQFQDNVNEAASIVLDGTTVITLATSGDPSGTVASVSGLTGLSYQNISPGLMNDGGEWKVTLSDPFSFNSISFVPANGGDNANLGDYAFVNFTTGVPEPSTWAMMVLGFCGLGFLAYRRKNGTLRIA
jgi:PEP-CTERM motif